jgi:hypothetical protein
MLYFSLVHSDCLVIESSWRCVVCVRAAIYLSSSLLIFTSASSVQPVPQRALVLLFTLALRYIEVRGIFFFGMPLFIFSSSLLSQLFIRSFFFFRLRFSLLLFFLFCIFFWLAEVSGLQHLLGLIT